MKKDHQQKGWRRCLLKRVKVSSACKSALSWGHQITIRSPLVEYSCSNSCQSSKRAICHRCSECGPISASPISKSWTRADLAHDRCLRWHRRRVAVDGGEAYGHTSDFIRKRAFCCLHLIKQFEQTLGVGTGCSLGETCWWGLQRSAARIQTHGGQERLTTAA